MIAMKSNMETKMANERSSENRKLELLDDYVSWVFEKKESDHGMRADFRRAISPAAEDRAWPYIAMFTNLTNDFKREAFVLIGSAICLDDAKKNGEEGLGQALFNSWEKTKSDKMSTEKNDPATMRLRRLLACRNGRSLCKVLRPILSVIRGKGNARLDYVKLLRNLLYFDVNPEKTKEIWAYEYFSNLPEIRNNAEKLKAENREKAKKKRGE